MTVMHLMRVLLEWTLELFNNQHRSKKSQNIDKNQELLNKPLAITHPVITIKLYQRSNLMNLILKTLKLLVG